MDDARTRVSALLAAHGYEVPDLTVVGSGLEFTVLRGTLAGRAAAIRLAARRLDSNDNDPEVDTRALLIQEAAILRHLEGTDVAVPGVLLEIHDEAADLLVTDYVDHDHSAAAAEDVIDMARRLHRLPAPPIRPVVQERDTLAATLIARIARRLDVVRRLAGRPLALDMSWWSRALDALGPERSLLHLDLRAENVLCKGNAVAALIDWSNMLIGPPALEWTRLAEYGELPADAVPPSGLPARVDALLRLDAAVMLAVVFLSEAPDEALAARQLARLEALADELRQ